MEYVESSRADAFNPKFEILSRVSRQAFPQLEGETFGRALLVQASLIEVTVAQCTFNQAQLLGATLERCRFYDSAFLTAEFNGTEFSDCSFTRVRFSTSTLRHCRFLRCTFEDCVFESENGEPLSENDGVLFVEGIFKQTAFVPAIPKESAEALFRGNWKPIPPAKLAAVPEPVVVEAVPSPVPVPPSVTPTVKNEDGRFGSLEL